MILAKLALALVHHPVVDRAGSIVTAAITNIDLHDISRSAYTWDAQALYVVHPIAVQQELARTIRTHWVDGAAGRRIPDRRAPLALVQPVDSLDEALRDFAADELWTTSARAPGKPALSWPQARALLNQPNKRILLAFGTAWGLAPEVHAAAHGILPAIESGRSDGYNHLSVRAAVAVTLDRLHGG